LTRKKAGYLHHFIANSSHQSKFYIAFSIRLIIRSILRKQKLIL